MRRPSATFAHPLLLLLLLLASASAFPLSLYPKTPLIKWAKANAIRLNPSLTYSHTFQDGLRGIRADRAIPANTTLIDFPLASCLVVGDQQPCPMPEFVHPAYWESAKLHERLALLLLSEKRKGKRSLYEGWIRELPTGYDNHIARWSDQELKLLRDPRLAEEAMWQKSAIDAMHEGFTRRCPNITVTVDEFRWAMDSVLSRSFVGQIPSEREACDTHGAKRLRAQVAMALLMRLGRKLPRVTHRLSVMFPRMRKYFQGTKLSTQLLLLEPIIDMANHKTTAKTDVSYDKGRDRVTFKTREEWGEGEQVFVCYGAKASSSLLLSYGFLEPSNPMETASLHTLEAATYALAREKGVSEEELDQRISACEAKGTLKHLREALVSAEGL
eukprot:CAMPEP_0172076296 /NCGR_PEP_ID=MMETSP1043-20130122/16424_1 /TAXON_ID=464988 /ORGANISM="Hemiselmis andersenii, Strain CCMP441" /LENGTH=385 /DNA_ID=CAMNT_0012737123 /DNA_START=73 /DNA_END=1227 /DNA_ORIENTATION=+